MTRFNQLVLNLPSTKRLAMPIMCYPGIQLLSGARKVRDVVTDAHVQFEASSALHQRYNTRVVQSAMDLSVEAEAFGSEVQMADDEIPTVVGSLITTETQARALTIPQPGDKRTGVFLDTVALLNKLPGGPLVLGGMIGPFSLAGRLVGLSEICGLTLTDPGLVHLVLERSCEFLTAYALTFKAAGADGVIMAEPAAGLLSPKALAGFSSAYVKQIFDKVGGDDFAIILHNCGAKMVHLAAILESGLKTFHFGSPMDIVQALEWVPEDIVLCGNLDPAGVFCSTPEEIIRKTQVLLQTTKGKNNFVVSSGCDLPAAVPLANLEAFFRTVQSF